MQCIIKFYSAEDCGGDLFMVAGWLGLDREGFRELVLERLEKEGIPEPDWNIQELHLCEWDESEFFSFYAPLPPAPAGTLVQVPNPTETWKKACYGHLYWTYPGVWSEKRVTRMPPELAAEFWDGDGVDRSDPKHPEWHSTHADIWDAREKGAS
jgi:hypothetical protein